MMIDKELEKKLADLLQDEPQKASKNPVILIVSLVTILLFIAVPILLIKAALAVTGMWAVPALYAAIALTCLLISGFLGNWIRLQNGTYEIK